MTMAIILFVANILLILVSIVGIVLFMGILYRGYILLGLLIAEKKNTRNQAVKD
ncbi:hypothetical protein [Paenibacillus sp. EKM11P]|uniref:hypothetical protein n=1 Tax=Paenibacillus sp. EKM11P TaxID=2708057 RepID=UPI001A9C0FA8|nr:hypothetical protein [Paenibacillus sp. EKM11P]